MSLARRIAALADRTAATEPFDVGALGVLQADPEFGRLAASLTEIAGHPDRVLMLILQALAVQRARLTTSDPSGPTAPEFAATVPGDVDCDARPTQAVLREMLVGPHRQVIALGYEISDDGVVRLLHEAALRCPNVILLCDRGRDAARPLRDGWPSDRYRPRLYENAVWPGAGAKASMHCKTLLVDGRDLLVTSANFTYLGLNGNLEFGTRLRDGSVRIAHRILMQLIRSNLFQEVPWN